MIIDANILKWTAIGMRKEGIGEYIEKREVERLLEEAHKRGYNAGYDVGVIHAKEKLKELLK